MPGRRNRINVNDLMDYVDLIRKLGPTRPMEEGIHAITPGLPTEEDLSDFPVDIPSAPYIEPGIGDGPGILIPGNDEDLIQGLEEKIELQEAELGMESAPGPGRRPTDDMLQLTPEELDEMAGDIEYEDPLKDSDITRARMPDVPGAAPVPMRPYSRAPGAPGTPVDPGFTQADMEEVMEKRAIYGGPTPIAPRAPRRAQLSPERQRALAQRKYLSRFMHPSVKFMFGNPKAWPYLAQMELGRMQAGTQGEALKESRAERMARDAMAQRKFEWQMSQGGRQHDLAMEQFKATERARLEALGFSREEAAARAKESADKLALVREQGESTERIRGMEFEELKGEREERRETAASERQADRDQRDQQHNERMAQYETEAKRLESEGKAAEARSVREEKQREEDQKLAREESEEIRSDSRAEKLRNTAQIMRARAEDMTTTITQSDRDNLRSRADELDIQADTIQGVEPPPAGELPPPPGVVPGDTSLPAGDAEKQLKGKSPGWYKQFEAQVELYGAKSAGVRGPLESPGEWLSWALFRGDYHPGDVNGLWYMRSFINDAISRGIVNEGNIKAVGAILNDRVISDVWGAMQAAEKDKPGTEEWFDAVKAGRMPDKKLLGFRYR